MSPNSQAVLMGRIGPETVAASEAISKSRHPKPADGYAGLKARLRQGT
jgi:hypothetical protein